MGLKKQYSNNDIRRYLMQQQQAMHKAIVNALMYLGEQCLIECRTNASFKDQTGNLRSSMGYVVVHNGKIISTSSFDKVSNGGSGALEGRGFVKSIAKQYTKDYVLIVVAGMNYAAYVESKGYNVLASAELLSRREMPKLMQMLMRDAN